MDISLLQERYQSVQERIAVAARRAGRNPDEIRLVAVTKTWPTAVLLDAYAVGMRHFGENRAEELAEKRPFLETELGVDNGITWHFIGTLQSRKTNLVADYADEFHALDRLKIGRRLANRLAANGRRLPSFLEINVSGESTKSGISVWNWEADATQRTELRKVIEETAVMPHLQLQGLMTMAPWGASKEEIQNVFQRARRLSGWLKTEFPDLALDKLSMGMTDDFELAIAEGATHVRVGRALFGERSK